MATLIGKHMRLGFPAPDAELADQIRHVRDAYREGQWQGERALSELERLAAGRLAELRAQASAVADANVRFLELVEQQEELAARLHVQNAELAAQNARIEHQRVELQAKIEAIADANVDAVLMADESEEKAVQHQQARERLSDLNRLLSDRALLLEKQAQALADSNAESVLLLDEHEQALAAARAQADATASAIQQLQQQAFVDALTGLFNHRYFKEQAAHEIARARRYKRQLSVVFVDADHFKQLNDTYGHQTGDLVLSTIGRLITSEIRDADIVVRMDGSPFAARYGGEEFVAILPETDLQGAAVAAERLRVRIAGTPIRVPGLSSPLRVTVSLGVAALSADDENADSLVARADAALYAAKKCGRNRVALAPVVPEEAPAPSAGEPSTTANEA